MAGSEDEKFIILDRRMTNIIKVSVEEDVIVHCLQGLPIAPISAISSSPS